MEPSRAITIREQQDIDELNESYPMADQPQGSKIPLRHHQLTLLQRCLDIENNQIAIVNGDNVQIRTMTTNMGIIGDKVGSGKSYVVLSLVLNSSNQTIIKPNVRAFGRNNVTLVDQHTHDYVKTNILVIPHNLSYQWEEYIKNFCPEINYAVVNKTKAFMNVIDTNISSYDLIVITCSYYNRLASILQSRDLRVRRVIYDEVDNMNIPSCGSIDSSFYWFVTASYGNLLHPKGHTIYNRELGRYIMVATGLRNPGFIKEIFVDLCNNTHTLNGNIINMLIAKNSDEYIRSSIVLPDIITQYIKCKTPYAINILNGFVDRNIIESLNAGDVESAIQCVSHSQRKSEDHIVNILIDKLTKTLQNINLNIQYMTQYNYDTEEERQTELNRLNQKKADLESKIQSIKSRIKDSEMCCICYDEIDNKTIVSCCSNVFCFNCLQMWLARKNTCPLCKEVITRKSYYVVQGDGTSDNNTRVDIHNMINSMNDKFRNLRNIVRSRGPNAKVLVFSAYENTFIQAASELEEIDIQYAFLKGNSVQIRNIIDRYKNGNINVLFVNTQHYGSGLNLENTSDVIMFHKFNSEVEKQVIGRAQRYGRTSALRLWYLLHDNELQAANVQATTNVDV